MQYICSEKPMRCPDKVTALHSLTHRIVFVNAPRCVFRSPLIFLSSCHAELVSASVRGDVLEMARCEILKFVIEREQSQACLNYAEREQIEQR